MLHTPEAKMVDLQFYLHGLLENKPSSTGHANIAVCDPRSAQHAPCQILHSCHCSMRNATSESYFTAMPAVDDGQHAENMTNEMHLRAALVLASSTASPALSAEADAWCLARW